VLEEYCPGFSGLFASDVHIELNSDLLSLTAPEGVKLVVS
jgi:hypothetical protein